MGIFTKTIANLDRIIYSAITDMIRIHINIDLGGNKGWTREREF